MRNRYGTRRASIWAGLAGLVLILAACGDSDAEADGSETATETTLTGDLETSSDEAPADEPADSEESESDGPESDAPVEDEPAEDEPGAGDTDVSGDGSCIVGSWVIAEGEMNKFYDRFEAAAGVEGEVDFDISGSTEVVFDADGTFRYVPLFMLSLSTGGIAGTGETSGSLSGTYTITDGVVATDITQDDMSIVVTVAGITIDSSELGTDLTTLPLSEAPVDCSGTNPVVGFDGGDGTRVPIELTPA